MSGETSTKKERLKANETPGVGGETKGGMEQKKQLVCSQETEDGEVGGNSRIKKERARGGVAIVYLREEGTRILTNPYKKPRGFAK